jgi:hypothetical protein
MQATDNLKKILEQEGIVLMETSTPEAIQAFNRLFEQGRWVGLGLHLFC